MSQVAASLEKLVVRSLIVAVLVGASAPPLNAQSSPRTFADPRPPKVRQLEKMTPPAPREYRGLEIRAAPRPLARDAVTEDVPSFLGPRRDLHTPEAPLRTTWSAKGPPLLWAKPTSMCLATSWA